MASILRVPYLGTAEDDVLLAEWFVDEGDAFRKGDAVAVVETLKATFEVEAEADGVLLRRVVAEGVRVSLQAAIGVVGEPGEQPVAADIDELVSKAAAERAGAASADAEPEPTRSTD
ncbi:MAG: pyruvate dehydrogenase complex dihydrolipoamide acetyltransferase, partial [Planctomycetes bacterium]|nr:pyruvate dehydrogenase complex dihydrolipoamide acetyltransferase [Planctomycetota bacterium]